MKLTRTDKISIGDQFVIFSAQDNDFRAVSAETLKNFLIEQGFAEVAEAEPEEP